MLDSITLKIQPAIAPEEIYSVEETLSGYRSKGRLRNLFISSCDEFTILKGSLPKFATGSNTETLSFAEISSTIEELENRLQTDISKAPILSLEWSSTIKTEQPPRVYYPILGETWPFERVPFKNSLYFNSPSKKALFYDKAKETRTTGNLLRYELRLPKAKSLGLTLGSLCQPAIFNQLTNTWFELYCSLNKIKKPMPKQVRSQRDLDRFYKSIAIEVLGGKDQQIQMIDSLHRQGLINDYNKSRMSKNLKNFIENIGVPTEFETELTEKFQRVANQNTVRL